MNLLPALVLVASWAEWWVFGRKGVALIERSPWLLLWVSAEVVLGVASGYVLVDAFTSRDFWRMGVVTACAVAGSVAGVATSGAIEWRHRGRQA